VQQYGGAVSADGTVYLVRTRNRNHWVCGSHTKLVRMDGGNGTEIATLPDGRDSPTPFALDETGVRTSAEPQAADPVVADDPARRREPRFLRADSVLRRRRPDRHRE
jgi:hypothetical protein